MEQLANIQQTTGNEIQRIIDNYKKDPANRKTLEYFKERLRRLEAEWDKFDVTDSDMRNHHPPQLDHPYFTKGYYDVVRGAYKEYRTIFNTNIDRLQQAANLEPKSSSIHVTKVSNDGYDQPKLQQLEGTPPLQPIETNGEVSAPLKRRQQYLMDTLQRNFNDIDTAANVSKHFWEVTRAKINQYWAQIEDTQLALVEQGVATTDDSVYRLMENNVQTTLIRCAAEIENLSGQAIRNIEGQNQFRLPSISLPKFDGNYLTWREFFDLFTQMVDKQDMPRCQKMWYLKMNVTGEAEKIIRHLPLTDDSYASAWQMLQSRYNNLRMLTTALFNRLLQQPIHTVESANSIKALHDITKECLQGLKNLGIDISSWDPLIVHLLLKKLDRVTHGLYEQSLKEPKSLPSLSGFLTFLEMRFQSLETLGNKGRNNEEQGRKPPARSFTSVEANKTTKPSCPCCNSNDHKLYACARFLRLTPEDRLTTISKFRICRNCFSPGHKAFQCIARRCTKCSEKHNTLLHTDISSANTISRPTQKIEKEKANTSASALAPKQKSYVFLSTVVVNIQDNENNNITVRALLDSGSQLNFITQRLSKQLKIPEFAETMRILGIGEGEKRSNKRVNLRLTSKHTGFTVNLEAFVLRQITPNQPTRKINIASWDIPKDLKLADPYFYEPGEIDLLLGAELYHYLLRSEQIKIGKDLPLLQNTHLGWIVAGKMKGSSTQSSICGISIENELQDSIEKFWKVEEAQSSKRALTNDERKCETHFEENTIRNIEGRFVVRLPFKTNNSALGTSKQLALQRFNALEKRLARQDELKEQYTKFIQEYIRLGHMEKIDFKQLHGIHYFLPHHCVLKPESTTTKLRVVFDASAKTSSNISLNDILSTGPTIQDELFTTLLRFRLHRYVFTADIEKMYRQIFVHPDDRRFQLILWRNKPTEELQVYQLNTVTYGTTSAPYLATKCLQKLASEGASKYPLGASILSKDFYVDDVMTGSDSLRQTLEMQDQLNTLLKTAGFTLRKWCANDKTLLKNIPSEDVALQLDLDIDNTISIKTLGQGWLPKSDTFIISIQPSKNVKFTKRTALSDISQLFDPLGFLGPVIITAKIFLQRLWAGGLDWDTPLPKELQCEWLNFRLSLDHLKDLKIDRHVFAHKTPRNVQLHTFADASEKAYGAAVYIRANNKDGTITVRLICAKSRVAPIKKLTIPRLELCAATLAAELLNRVQRDLHLESCPTFMWTDSEIVLGWINSSSSSFHTFVANRISSIQEMTSVESWRHVRSKDNPADLLSRGIPAEKFTTCNLWFYGPFFLHGAEASWPGPYTKTPDCNLERRETRQVLSTVEQPVPCFIYSIEHQNDFRRLQRVTAYILRYCHNLKAKIKLELVHKSGPLRPTELYKAEMAIIKQMQEEEFKDDIKHLQRHSETPKGSPITSLTPFIDEEGAVRVGGRLEASSLSYEAKHPLLLPYSHPFSRMLMNAYHKENLHCGPQALLASIKQRFWPIKGKALSRSVVQKCVRCTRAKPKLLTQLMGNLPAHRIQPARPFLNTGVDFCGPIKTHYKVRGKHPQKTYIAVFCCFATKAVHLELVTDLSTNGFIAAIKRFIGRRGICHHIYCDNATNFVGANNQLQELTAHIHTQEAQEKIQNSFSSKGLEFHFIPPRAPHFGGLWEAAVKSAKYHLHRCLGSASLTYEELETVVIEIEAILNSRPLTVMSNDPNDLKALTPGHFIIGEPLNNPTDVTAHPPKFNLSNQLRLISNIKNDFWKRWHSEYLHELQQRHKWQRRVENLLPGTMVIIKEDNCPVMRWPLGRVIQTFPGSDGLVRVAEIQTASSVLRRPIHRLAPLPIQTENPEENKIQQVSPLTTTPTNSIEEQEEGEIIEEDEEHKGPPRKKRCNSLSTINLMIIVSILLPIIIGGEVNVATFKNNPGIHFENLGTAHIMCDKWDLIVYYDLRPYWKELKWLNVGHTKLKEFCTKVTPNESCLIVLQQFQHLLNEINDKDGLLEENVYRSKRGAINIVGNLANSLFGVLDSEYAQHMSETISNIHQNEDHLLRLMKNQTSIINSTANIIRVNDERQDKRFQLVETELKSIISQLNRTNDHDYQLRITQLMLIHSMQLFMTATNLQKVQALLLDLITDVHHGQISANLIQPSQLRKELNNIRAHLPSTLRLPELHENMSVLYKLMNAQGRISGSNLIFKLSLPLLRTDYYDLFSINPVPVVVNTSFIAVRPNSDYIIINLHRTQYYTLNEDELKTCTTIIKNEIMCHQRHPLYQKGSNASRCEFNFMNQLFDHTCCQFESFTDDQYWKELHQPNHWIYSVQRPSIINVVCARNLTQVSLEDAGIITVSSGCSIKTDRFTIQGHNMFESSATSSYIPSHNLSDMISQLPQTTQLIIHHPIQVVQETNNMKDLQREIQQQQLEETLREFKNNDTHQFALSFAAIIVTLGISLHIIWKYVCRRTFHPRNSQPSTPTSQPQEAFTLHV